MTVRASIDLPFAPRLQWLSHDGSRLVVADAFGGKLAVIDSRAARLLAIRSLEGHNIRGLAADHEEKELLVAHQLLNERVPTTRDGVFWGNVMGNVVRCAANLEEVLTKFDHADGGKLPASDLADLLHFLRSL